MSSHRSLTVEIYIYSRTNTCLSSDGCLQFMKAPILLCALCFLTNICSKLRKVQRWIVVHYYGSQSTAACVSRTTSSSLQLVHHYYLLATAFFFLNRSWKCFYASYFPLICVQKQHVKHEIIVLLQFFSTFTSVWLSCTALKMLKAHNRNPHPPYYFTFNDN